MATSNTIEFEALAEVIRAGYQASPLNVTEFAQFAGVATRTVYAWVVPGRLEIPSPEDLSDRRKARGISNSIIRLLYATGNCEIATWLTKVGLEAYVDGIVAIVADLDMQATAKLASPNLDSLLDNPITEDDWIFIERMKTEFGNNMTIGFLIELLKRRKINLTHSYDE